MPGKGNSYQFVAALSARGRSVKQSSLPCRTKGNDGPHFTAAILIVGLTIVAGMVSAPALDARAHDAPARPRWTGTADSLRAAVNGLSETFGPKYPQGAVYLERLEALMKAGARPGDPALEQLAAEALLANPLLDQLPLALVKRPNFGGHDSFFGYTSYVKRSPAELCVLESVQSSRCGSSVSTSATRRAPAGCARKRARRAGTPAR
jgi:hypothetical protein